MNLKTSSNAPRKCSGLTPPTPPAPVGNHFSGMVVSWNSARGLWPQGATEGLPGRRCYIHSLTLTWSPPPGAESWLNWDPQAALKRGLMAYLDAILIFLSSLSHFPTLCCANWDHLPKVYPSRACFGDTSNYKDSQLNLCDVIESGRQNSGVCPRSSHPLEHTPCTTPRLNVKDWTSVIGLHFMAQLA